MNSIIENKADTKTISAELLAKYIDRRVLTSLEACVRCGICTESCHYYQSNPIKEHTPYYRAEKLRRLFRQLLDPAGRVFPRWFSADKISENILPEIAEIAFSRCTLCQRCTLACPFGVETAEIMRITRAIATATGNAPEMLIELANIAIAKEENFEIFNEIYREQIKELEKEVQNILGNSKARIPVGEQGANILYAPLAGAHTIVPQAIIFNLVGESWSLASFESSNYAVFLSDIDKAKRIAQRITRETERVKATEIVITECGHGYTTMRWDLPKWLNKPLPFKVRNVVELIDEYIQTGRLHIDPKKNSLPTTYHDSCNLGRKGGIIKEPRRIIKSVSRDYREMIPGGLNSYCCGAGSGLVAVPELTDIRMEAGKKKAEQIHNTGAKLVVTSCDNCRHQIGELSEHYNLGVEVTSVSELVVKALA